MGQFLGWKIRRGPRIEKPLELWLNLGKRNVADYDQSAVIGPEPEYGEKPRLLDG